MDKSAFSQRQYVEQVVTLLGAVPDVRAIALAGSRGGSSDDARSDFDLYVYTDSEVPEELRRKLGGPAAEIGNRFWELGDEWVDAETGARIDVMYRNPEWIREQLERVLVRHEASIGYTTCFWYNVLHSEAVYDPQGWFAEMKQRATVPYPEELRRAIVAKNWPILRRNQSSYRHQIALAVERSDWVSVQHRITVLLASFFDLWFALEHKPHPGEKRLLHWLPEEWQARVVGVLRAEVPELLDRLDALLDPLDAMLREQGLIR